MSENPLKISIITVVKNAENTISRCLSSLIEQTYSNVEIIVMDGASTDGTLGFIEKFRRENLKIYSEKDLGIYDALNKGISRSTGDIIGLLHSDDYLSNELVLEDIANEFSNTSLPIIIGKLSYFHPDNLTKIVRRYYPFRFSKWMFRFGMAPPHPAFYAKRELFERYGNYRTDLEIAGDFDLMLRFLYLHKVPYKCIDENWVMMSTGGKSTNGWTSIIKNNKDILTVCRDHHFYSNYMFIYAKYLIKTVGLLIK
ncbi:glycosyltransferase family 2 protein [Pedobacter sp. ASV28]|uniref:glycosyltransferase family 2 protein n=1 Tax=Pedobacter sp. ASV28 TaxID=2795123 RepID=UPI0018ECC743|nr:glycosyltransferase family 2 protein [Pedobacter sp. ASV28]